MTALLFLPVYFFKFWFGEAPVNLLRHFQEINKAYFQLFSARLLLQTLFQPVKNEYRKGLVGFSIAMGIFLKTCILGMAVVLFLPILVLEFVLFTGFLAFPLVTLALLVW